MKRVAWILFVLVIFVIGCEQGSPTAPTQNTFISVTWPVAGNDYRIGDGVRIEWNKSSDIEHVSIILRRIDGLFGNDITEGVLLFSAIPGDEILWREWWRSPLEVPEGTYVFRVEATDTLVFGERIGGESGAVTFIRSAR